MRPAFRVLPRVTDANRHFWTGGRDGELRLLRCRACRHWIHPPSPVCPACVARDPEVEPVSGRGRIVTFTVNHQPWIPGFDPPYIVAIVELEEQVGLRLTTQILDCDPDHVFIDQPVRVVFEAREGVFLPLFEPVS